MKQIIQNLKTGETTLEELPAPQVKAGHVQIQTSRSLISAGTERMLVEFGKANLLDKARQQPEKVKMVLEKVRTDGLMPTIDAVRSKLDKPIPLGYCNSGIIQGLGDLGIEGLKVGDRVVSNGPHAEVVCVSRNLCARVPDDVSDEEAAFTVVGAIGLQGIRLAQPTLGEIFVVTGLGLVGQLTVQLLMAHGCKVLGVDIDPARCSIAQQFGAEAVDLSKGEDPVDMAVGLSQGRGADGVLITAATKSSEPVHQAAQMCRKRGRIVLVGVTGLELKRSDFYEKELSFQVSCSYGPGRYDTGYEEKGHDYPIGFVRWTEQRNFEAVLDLMASGKIDVKPLITHRFRFEDAGKAYELIAQNKEAYLGIILEYNPQITQITQREKHELAAEERRLAQIYERSIRVHQRASVADSGLTIGFIGAGNFTGQVLLPALKKTGARLKSIASSGGVSGTHLGKKFGFEESTTYTEKIFSDPEINTIFITTRHDTHAALVIEALKAGKNVFVEKPLAINKDELNEIETLYNSKSAVLMVGFNRRFSSHTIKIKDLLVGRAEPLCMNMTVNGGKIPADHWTQDPVRGGGRIIGEGCHFIDLLSYIADSPVVTVSAVMVGGDVAVRSDKMSIVLGFADGSVGTVNYFSNGSKSYPKETLEIFSDERVLRMENFRVTKGYGFKGFKRFKTLRQDKGHKSEIVAFIDRIKSGGEPLIPFDQLANATEASFAAMESAREGRLIKLAAPMK
ncbi:MAG: bi-domain-containing oxidoreductase [Thermodesulfobacteriota bacterium]|nr:bi-domain-containing oxidoreductase [Thermodesulfobacteriota bacterium]